MKAEAISKAALMFRRNRKTRFGYETEAEADYRAMELALAEYFKHTTPAPIDAEVREALADVELCMRDYAYDPLLGRKLRKHLTTIRAALKNGGSE